MKAAQQGGRKAAEAEGLQIALEVYEAVKGLVQGVHISAPSGDLNIVVKLLESV